MFDFIKTYQLDIMLILCGACGIMAILLLLTRFLDERRKRALFLMEISATFLLWFDRMAYIYSADQSHKAYVMVRVSNFIVFFLTCGIIFSFNSYIKYLIVNENGIRIKTKRLEAVRIMTVIGMLMSIVSAFTDFYYYFDDNNKYHRGPGFLVAYIIPVVCPLIQYTVIRQYKKILSKLIYISLVLYIFVPIVCGVIQIFAYGISIVNMAMVAVSVSLYIFTYLDINDTVKRAHDIEIQNMLGEQHHMRKLFDQLAKAFVTAVEKKDDFAKGTAVRVADYARKVAEIAGKDEEQCDNIYYAALLHDAGLIGIPDSVIKNEEDPEKMDVETYRLKPVIGKEILSNITEYPFLSIGAYYSHERYNGTGYPEGLKGEEIPDIARVIAVADAYVTMTSKKRYRDARPEFVAREAFVKGAGVEFDPDYAGIMIKIIDEEARENDHDDISIIEKSLSCKEYKENVSLGIPVGGHITNISFNCVPEADTDGVFSAPSIILFDSYDRRVHDNEKTIKAYRYQEYGEIWFDKNSITTAARKIRETEISDNAKKELEGISKYKIIAAKADDHVKLIMKSPSYEKEVLVALVDGSTSVYIGITGEHCKIENINIEQTDEVLDENSIPRILSEVSYIDHMESDLKNVQINQTRSATTEGVELKKKLKITFHNMSLPVANFIWHCPYVVIYSSDDGQTDGENYREYALIKINGENEVKDKYAENTLIMKKTDAFPGWDIWKERNKEGVECEVNLERTGNIVFTATENIGIHIENTTVINEHVEKIYVALTGDRCALTDIRVK